MAYLNAAAGARREGSAAAITAADLGVDSVAASEIAAGAVGTAELADDAVTAAKIAAGVVGTAELADDAVDAAKIAAGAVGTSELAAAGVTFAKAKVFISTEVTATGAAQNVAHGLAVTPAGVLVVPTEHPGVPDTGAFDIAEGTHTSTNVVVTITADVKFKVFAWV